MTKDLRHYEIVLLIHPDQSDQVPAMVKRYIASIEENGGKVNRYEDWGRRPLEYLINNLPKAHYLLFNIECSKEFLENELKTNFRYNDAVIRELVLKRKQAITAPSPMMQNLKSGETGTSSEGSSSADNESRDVRHKKYPLAESAPEREVDYKDLQLSRAHIMESGRIVPRRISRIKALRQRQLTEAIKRGRFLALLEYCDRHKRG